MIYAFFLFVFVQKSFLTKNFFPFAEMGPLYTCLVFLFLWKLWKFIEGKICCKYRGNPVWNFFGFQVTFAYGPSTMGDNQTLIIFSWVLHHLVVVSYSEDIYILIKGFVRRGSCLELLVCSSFISDVHWFLLYYITWSVRYVH